MGGLRLLVCGGAGYLGSHTCVELARRDHAVAILDNLSNSSVVAVERVRELAGRPIEFFEGDLRDPAALARAFAWRPDAVLHFAAKKSVPESYAQPLEYFDNNIAGTIALLR